MNLLDILRTIGISEFDLKYFNNGYIMKPVYKRGSNVTRIKINLDEPLPFEVYRQLKECFEKYLETEVDLVILANDCHVNTVEITRYFDYYFEKNDIRDYKSVIPNVEGKLILINDIDPKTRINLERFLADCGIDYHITIRETDNDEPMMRTVYDSTPGDIKLYARNRRGTAQKTDIDKSAFTFTPMNRLHQQMDRIWFTGKVFKVEYQTLRSKLEMQKIYMTDYGDAAVVKRFEGSNLPSDQLHSINVGMVCNVYGNVRFDKYDNTDVIEPVLIEPLDEDPWERRDDYQGTKHADLHVHTNRTEMDGISKCRDIIMQAYKFGQPAIAITDIGVVQAFPQAQDTLLEIDRMDPDNNFRIIYGTEMKVVDEKLSIVFNPDDTTLGEAEYCVLDLETTGLSTKDDYIIEFGGVIVKNNDIDRNSPRLQMFIKPPVSIPPFVENKTNITNDMVKDAPPLEEAIDRILEFIGDRVVVAHNADFDFNFLNDKLIEMGREPLKNVCLDTLNLSRAIIKNRKYYRLGMIANNYGVDYDDEVAHRGDYDAEVLAMILTRMLPTIKDWRQKTFRQLQEDQDPENYKKARTYNVTLLAKNQEGIKALYELISLSHTKYLTYFAKENAKKADSDVVAEPRILRSEIEKRRANLLVGSCNVYSELFEMALTRSDEAVSQCMDFYDYVEIQPVSCYRSVIEEGSSVNDGVLMDIIRNIVDIAEEKGKLVIANNDVYYAHPYQKIARDIYIMAKRIGGSRHPLYPLNRQKRLNFTGPDQHLMTTDEMLEAFDFMPPGDVIRYVIDNPLELIKDIKKMYPIPQKLASPSIDGCEEKLTEIIYNNAYKRYGNPLPEIVRDRIEKELNSVITNGFSVQYYIAHLLVKKSNEDGFIVGSRGSVGSSLIATMADITEVNPLVPHYLCPNCQHSEFFTDNEYANGFDLPEKKCPVCGAEMQRNGHSIPFETFLGFKGDKVPDIDLNFSAEYQNKAQLLIKDIFGENWSYRAGTIGTVAQKTAYGYIKGYCEEMEKLREDGKPIFSNAWQEFLSYQCEDVKRTTGQHPGGIVVIPRDKDVNDFTPIQYPANNPFADWLTTHFAFADLHDTLLKLDILGHVDPTAVRLLQLYTGVAPKDIPMNDPKAMSLFSSIEALNINDPKGYYHELNGAAGLPEFGTRNNRNILNKTKPTTFAELVSLSGLTHGTNVWANNAEELIDNNICTLKEVIGCRDDIMVYLISKNMESKEAFDIMEKVRKGKGLTPQWIADMKAHEVPDWYIDSCQKIEYMFPKAHAVAYVMMAMRIAWCKVYYPAEYYAVFFSCRCDAYDIETMLAGPDAVYEKMQDIQNRKANRMEVTNKEEALEDTFEICMEMFLRGFHFSNISLDKSEAVNFIVDPDDRKCIVPSFNAIDGMGENVARSIVTARNEHSFLSKEDLQKRTQINYSQMLFMERIGALDGLSDEDQLTLFS